MLFFCLRFISKQNKKSLCIIPHAGCYTDCYSISNYRSDNALSLCNYIIDNYGKEYEYYVAVDAKETSEIKSIEYKGVNVVFFPYFNFQDLKLGKFYKLVVYIRNIIKVYNRCSVFFTSTMVVLSNYKRRKQQFVYCGYYIPFKNDYMFYKQLDKYYVNCNYDVMFTTSLLSSQIISLTYAVPIQLFKSVGFSRNDQLLTPMDLSVVDEDLKKYVDYEIKMLVLYTPTHRDYENGKINNERNLLGFEYDAQDLSDFLRENGILILCKVHSHQNPSVLNKKLPSGIAIHIPNKQYGLCELMKRSDCLMTDYTSAYFDYILLDRPVLFNFYDYDLYERTRGFSYDPLDAIIAGDIVSNVDSFKKKIMKVVNGIDEYKDKRHFVRALVHKYIDNNSSCRICKEVLDNN